LPQQETYNVNVEAMCEAKPNFQRLGDGAFLMQLSGIDVHMKATCDPYPSTGAFFRPQTEFFEICPELQHVVFEPLAQTPGELSRVGRTRKCITILEVPAESDLNAKIRTNSPTGSITLEDVRHIGSCRDIVSAMTLNYDLRANGQILISTHASAHVLRVEFDFEFRCWLTGSMKGCADAHHVALGSESESAPKPLEHKARQHNTSHGAEGDVGDSTDTVLKNRGQTPMRELPISSSKFTHPNKDDHSSAPTQSDCMDGLRAEEQNFKAKANSHVASSLRLSSASANALRELDHTKDELVEIERRVENIASLLAHASSSDASQLKAELSQIEAKAKQLESLGIDDIYTGDLRSGKQMAKDTKKEMLARFEFVFEKIDTCFRAIQAKLR
jgi:hypothetical protein